MTTITIDLSNDCDTCANQNLDNPNCQFCAVTNPDCGASYYAPLQPVTPKILEILRLRLLPESRRHEKNMLMADWEACLRMAFYLGFAVERLVQSVNLEAKQQCSGLGDPPCICILPIAEYRQILIQVDRLSNTNYWEEFETNFLVLRAELLNCPDAPQKQNVVESARMGYMHPTEGWQWSKDGQIN